MGQQASIAFPPSASVEDRLLTLDDVVGMTTLSRAEIYRRHLARTFPDKVQLGPRAIAYRLSDIQRWIRELPAAEAKAATSSADAEREPAAIQPPEPELPPPKKRRRRG